MPADARCMLFTWKVMNGRKCHMLRQVMESVLLDLQDSWTVQVLNLCGAGGIGFLNNRLPSVRRSLTDSAVVSVLSSMKDHISLLCMSQPDCWFKLQHYVNDSSLCRCYAIMLIGKIR